MTTAHGGKRAGAGRKPGSLNTKTKEVAEAAMKSGITPLEVMIGTMRELWEQAEEAEDPGQRMALKQQATDAAVKAAPYMHPRLANVEANVKADVGIQVTTLPKDDKL
jgi:hypothetical protein